MAIDREKVLQAAQKFVEKKKYDKAILEYQKLIQEDPNDARTLLKIGDLQSKMEAYADAVATYERVGKFYAQQGFALKAIAVFKQIREIIAKHVPRLEERYGHVAPKLAELYQQLGLTSDALAALDEVATRLQRQGRDPEAIETFRKIVELDPTNPLPHLRLAEALSRTKEIDAAVTEFGIATGQLIKLGRRDDAIKVVERLLHHRPDSSHARIAAELYLARGQPNDGLQALSKLQICFQNNPKDLDTLALLARAFTAIGQAAKAVEVQKEMARIAKEQGKADLFKQLVEKLLRLAPNDEGVRQLVAAGPVPPPAPEPASRRLVHNTPATAPAQPPPTAPTTPGVRRGAQVDELSYDSVGDSEIEAADEPFDLKSERPRAPSPQQPPQQQPQRSQPQPTARAQQNAPQAPPRPQPQAPPQVSQASHARAPQPPAPPRPAQRGAPPQPAPQYTHDDDVLVDSSVEVIEEIDDHVVTSSDARTQLARVMADAASFRRARMYSKAIDTLRIGVEIAPRSVEVREALRDTLIEGGYSREAVIEMLALASLQVDALDGDGAAQTLQDVLAIDPNNMRAADMLRELGYELIDESAPSVSYEPTNLEETYDPDAPLPSYDLEEIGPGDISQRKYSDPNLRVARQVSGRLDDIDDPFGEAPLPAYPLDSPSESEAAFDLVSQPPGPTELSDPFDSESEIRTSTAISLPPEAPEVSRPSLGSVTAPGTPMHARGSVTVPTAPLMPSRTSLSGHGPGQAPPPAIGRGAAARPQAPAPPPAPPPVVVKAPSITPPPELEEALEEADFFVSRGLYDDARTILDEQNSRLPNHPLIRERYEELNAQQRRAQAGSGAREVPRSNGKEAHVDRSFDIAASLDDLDLEDMQPAEGEFGPDGQVDVEEVFAKFKEGVAKQISVDDAQSHYDLGVAYKEMGLVEDAIREFEVAARDPKRECVCQSMIGMIQLERGSLNESIDAFMRGLHAPLKTAEQDMVLSYEIGACYEAKKMAKEALNYYQRVAKREPNYRDVQGRIQRLTKPDAKPPLRAAVGADDEFDRAFDDIMGDSKLP